MRSSDKIKKLTRTSLAAAVAMILSYLESMLPSIGIPGVKLGLANIAVIFVLYRTGIAAAAAVSLVRVVTVGILFGNPASLMYSIAGAVLSLAVMYALRRVDSFSLIGVSVSGGVAHNAGQIIMASFILGTEKIVMYLPVLIVSGTIAGVLVGYAAGGVLKLTEKNK